MPCFDRQTLCKATQLTITEIAPRQVQEWLMILCAEWLSAGIPHTVLCTPVATTSSAVIIAGGVS